MSRDADDRVLRTMADPRVQTGLVLLGLERKDLPALCFTVLAGTTRLETPAGLGLKAACHTLRWLSKLVPAAWLLRAGWRANARYSAVAFASSLELAVQIEKDRQDKARQIRALAVEAMKQLSESLQAILPPDRFIMNVMPLDLTARAQLATLAQAAKQAVVLCVASIDWAEDDEPPSLAAMQVDDAYTRARLHFTLRDNPVPAASMQDSAAHGAEGEGRA